MPVKIRLARRGRKKQPIYDIVVADSRAPRDGRFIEKLGTFNPNKHPAIIMMDTNRALHWVMTGAQPTDTARTILSKMGVMLKKHLQVGISKGALTEEQADRKFQDWKSTKDLTNLVFKEDGESAPVLETPVVESTPAPAPVVEEETPAPIVEEEVPAATVETETAPEVEEKEEIVAEVETPQEEVATEEPVAESEATAEENTEETEKEG